MTVIKLLCKAIQKYKTETDVLILNRMRKKHINTRCTELLSSLNQNVQCHALHIEHVM